MRDWQAPLDWNDVTETSKTRMPTMTKMTSDLTPEERAELTHFQRIEMLEEEVIFLGRELAKTNSELVELFKKVEGKKQ